VGRRSTRRARVAAAAVAGALLAVPAVLAAGGSAAAGTGMTGQIVSWQPQQDGHATAVFGLQNPTADASIDPSTVQVMIDGQKVPSTAKPIGQDTTAPVRSTVLSMDVSGSMNEKLPTGIAKLTAAKQAADSYLKSVPGDVKVGLVSFADKVTVLVPPTTDHVAVRKAVDALTATGATHLYDAVITSVGVLGTTGVRSQLVLSDGADEGSTATLAKAAGTVKSSGGSLDAVSLGATTSVQLASLSTLAAAGGGQVVPTNDAAKLTDVFTQQAVSQASQVVVDVTVPSSVSGTSKNVQIAAAAGGQTVGGAGFYIMPTTPTSGPTDAFASYGPQPVAGAQPGITAKPWFLPVAFGALALGLFALLAVAFLSSDRDSQQSGRVRRRLARYSLTARSEAQQQAAAPTSGALGQSQVARSATEFAGRMVQSRDLDSMLSLKLEAAGLPLRPGEWLIIHVGIAVAVALVLALLTGFAILATLLGLLFGLLGPYLYLSIKEGRRKSEFAAALPGTLQLLAGSLAAGHSLPQAVDTVVRDSNGPMAIELNRALVESRLGVPVEDALDGVAQRMDSVDFHWVVMAIRIQREVGGNLAEVLSTVAATMRERERLRRQVQVLSAEGRLSAVILGAMPIVFAAYLVIVRPEYIGVLLTSPLGIIMIVAAVVMMIAGAFWLKRVITVEV
jgi:tight adherence protein B